ncbi:MAG: amidohydrolase family protein [Clostridiales bacterium]|nr:amidohydrolase family protein [Clostridiales bacterium]
MIFGLFKKTETADVVFRGGKIYTPDSSEPWAGSVACKAGRIMALGDDEEIEGLIGKNTETIDLEGGFLLPGFIDICGHPVLQSFQNVCLLFEDGMTQSQVLSALSKHIEENPDKAGYLGYGYSPGIIAGKSNEDAQRMLDEVCPDKPIALLDASGLKGWFNTCSMDQVKAAIKDEIEPPKFITLQYVLQVLSLIDFDLLQEEIASLAAEYCKRGYTTVFDCGAPDYLHSIYQDVIIEMHQAGLLKQRLIGSYLVTKNITPEYAARKLSQKHTSCTIVEDFVSCRAFKLVVGEEDGSESNVRVAPELLKAFSALAVDNGFDMHVDVTSKDAVFEACDILSRAGASGNRKSHFIVAHSCELSQEERGDLLFGVDLCESFATLGDFNKKQRALENAKDAVGAIDALTIDAAELLGIIGDWGMIEGGRFADFVIFREDPFNCSLEELLNLDAWMTVIGGEVVFDADVDSPEGWLEILMEKHQEMQEMIAEEEDWGY